MVYRITYNVYRLN